MIRLTIDLFFEENAITTYYHHRVTMIRRLTIGRKQIFIYNRSIYYLSK
jgi:hypothetical protein